MELATVELGGAKSDSSSRPLPVAGASGSNARWSSSRAGTLSKELILVES